VNLLIVFERLMTLILVSVHPFVALTLQERETCFAVHVLFPSVAICIKLISTCIVLSR